MRSCNRHVNRLSLILEYVICPACGSDLGTAGQALRCAGCGRKYEVVGGRIPSMLDALTADAEFSMRKWDERYLGDDPAGEAERAYKRWYLDDTKRQVLEQSPATPGGGGVFLEVGCGLGFLGEELARDGWLFIGIDFSLNSLLLLERRLTDRGIDNYLLVHGDILSLPIRDRSLDLVYGGGAIEHFKGTQTVISNIFRALKAGGVSFNTVPFFNVGNLLYRSLWGGIPNVPVLRWVSEFVHLRVLGGRHMAFGYELQFTRPQLLRMHFCAGFSIDNVIVGRFDCQIQLEKIGDGGLKSFLIRLCRTNRHFWPMVKVVAVK